MTAPDRKTEERLYRSLSRALDALRNSEGHDTGAYGLVYDLIRDHCPNAADAEARRSQGDFNDWRTT